MPRLILGRNFSSRDDWVAFLFISSDKLGRWVVGDVIWYDLNVTPERVGGVPEQPTREHSGIVDIAALMLDHQPKFKYACDLQAQKYRDFCYCVRKCAVLELDGAKPARWAGK